MRKSMGAAQKEREIKRIKQLIEPRERVFVCVLAGFT